MRFKDYIDAVVADLRSVILCGDVDHAIDVASNVDTVDDDTVDRVREYLDTCDCVTGNGSGSYTFNSWEAAQNVGELLFDDDFVEECDDLDISIGDILKRGPEAVDVTARCLALYHADDDIERAISDRVGDIIDGARNADWYRDSEPAAYIAARLDDLRAVGQIVTGDPYGVCIGDAAQGFRVWLDVSIDDGDVCVDWNKYIFNLNDNDDVWRREFQDYTNSYGDAVTLDVCGSIAIDRLEALGYIAQDSAGLWHYAK